MPRKQATKVRLTRRVRLDRRGAEALKIEVRRLARRLGVSVTALQIRRVEGQASPRRSVPRAQPRPR